MPRTQIAAALPAIAAVLIASQPLCVQTGVATPELKLRDMRTHPNDLQISGQVPGIPTNQSRFLTRDDLLALSQPLVVSSDDGNFKVPAMVRAISLETLASALGVSANEMIVADCKDKYQAHYTRAYLAAHHPVLVTELDGKPLPGSLEHPVDEQGPYMIAHEHFAPAFRIFAHSDEPQTPWGVIALQFRNEKLFLAPIQPQGPAANKSARAGYQIAEQNCLRCHYNGTTGGAKSGVGWDLLTNLATHAPEFLAQYVRDPKARNPQSQMPASPEYDDATMRALIAYFTTFAPAGSR